MLAEMKTAQCRVIGNSIIAEGCSGTIFYATPTRARLLIDAGAVVLVNTVGPSNAQVVGPSETKPTGPQEKKTSLTDSTDGHSTDSPASTRSGKGDASQSLVEDHRLQKRKYNKRGTRAAK